MHRFYESNNLLHKVQSLSPGPSACGRLVTHLFPASLLSADGRLSVAKFVIFRKHR